jgi:hypothetical protein
MPLLPIDLQILFSQTYQVGKEQAAQKDMIPNAQAAQGSQLAHQVDARDNKVNETTRQEDGPEQVKMRNRRERQGKRKREGEEKEKKLPEKKDVFRDPALGSRIDITS